MRMLGSAYQYGKGVAKDIEQARHWFGKAIALGNAEAGNLLASLPPPPPKNRLYTPDSVDYPGHDLYMQSATARPDTREYIDAMQRAAALGHPADRKSTRLNSSH